MKLYISTFFLFILGSVYVGKNQAHAVEMGFSAETVRLGDSLVGAAAPFEDRLQFYSFLEGAEEDKEFLVDLVNTYTGPAAVSFDKADALRTLALENPARRTDLVSQANDLLPPGMDPHTKVQFLNGLQKTPFFPS